MNGHMTLLIQCHVLTHADVRLAPAGEIVEGQPLKLTCTVLGHTPEDSNVKILYDRYSGKSIANCCSDTTDPNVSNSDNDYHNLTCTCELSAYSTQSNSGNYSCSASIKDMVVSSGEFEVVVNVEPRKDLKTIIVAPVGSSAGLVLLATCIVIILYYVRRKCYRNQADLEHEPLMREGVVDEDDHAGIRDNIILLGKGHH